LKTLYRKRAVTWPFIFYTIIWTLSQTVFLTRAIYDLKINKTLIR
ncbi:sodium transporter, partial [Enterococcus faecium]